MSQPRPLMWWSQSGIARVAAMLDELIAAWRSDWGVADDGARVTGINAPLAEMPSLDWRACGEENGFVGGLTDCSKSIEHALFSAAGQGDSMGSRIAQRAGEDLLGRVLGALKLPPVGEEQAPPPEAQQKWSGAVLWRLPVCGASIDFLLPAPAARALLGVEPQSPSRPILAALPQAIGLMLSACLETFTLTPEQLQALQQGDVLRLPHRLDRPLNLQAQGGASLTGWLGEREGSRAVMLSADPLNIHQDTTMSQSSDRSLQPLTLQPLPQTAAGEPLDAKLTNVAQVSAEVSVCVGRVRMSLAELAGAKTNQVITLDQLVGDPVDLMVSGQVVARGELMAVEDHFAVRITEPPRASKVSA